MMPATRVSSCPLQHHDILAGSILWLPRKLEIDDHLLVGVDIDKGCFNHPIVVLSTDQVGGKATILIVSITIQRSLSYYSNSQLTSKAYFV